MAVVVSFRVHFEEERIHLPGDKQSWTSYDGVYLLVEWVIFTEGAGIKRDSELFYKFYADYAVFSSAEGN